MRGPVLIIAQSSDPIVATFSRYAIQRRLSVWMPSRLDAISWSWQQGSNGSSVEVSDRDGANVWNDGTLSGVWFRSLPEFPLPAGLDETDQRYVVTEVTSSFTMAWLKSRCPLVGIVPTVDSALADAGPETRTEFRRLGVSTMTDCLGSFGDIVAKMDGSHCDAWITASRRSGWLGDLLASSHLDELANEIVIASPSHKEGMCAAIYVDSDLRLVSLSNRRAISIPPVEIVSAVNLVREATHLRVGVCYFVRDSDRWLMVRVSPHVPNWLDARSNAWVADRLCGFFKAPPRPFRLEALPLV
jgi:hypothetical protein